MTSTLQLLNKSSVMFKPIAYLSCISTYKLHRTQNSSYVHSDKGLALKTSQSFRNVQFTFIKSADKTKYLHLFVVRPKITSKSKSKVTVHEGNVLFLKCKVEGVPTPFVIWRKDGLVIQNQTKPHTYFMRENATKAEKGEYVCEASNSGGSDSYMVEVKIIPLKGMKYRWRI